MENRKASDAKKPTPAAAPAAKPPVPAAPPQKVPPLFRKIDWLTFVVTFLFVFIGYLLSLAPEMTLEDSGELAAQPRHLAAFPARAVGTDRCREVGHEPGAVVTDAGEREGGHERRL